METIFAYTLLAAALIFGICGAGTAVAFGILGGKLKLGSCGLGFLKLFGFEDEAGALVKVYAPVAGRAVGMLLNNGELEKISLVRLGVGLRHAKQIAKAKQEWLRVGPLRCAGR